MNKLNYILISIIAALLLVMMLPTCNKFGNPEQPLPSTDTLLHSSTLSVDIDSVAFEKHIIAQYLKTHKTKTYFRKKIGKNDTIINNYCDSINEYLDTLKQGNISVFNRFEVRGELLSHESSATYKELHVSVDSTRTDTVIVRVPYLVEVPKKTFKDKVRFTAIGTMLGVIATLVTILAISN